MEQLDDAGVLTINVTDIQQAFPSEQPLPAISQEQLNDIAALVRDDLFQFDDYFWNKFTAAIRTAAMTVLEMEE